MASKPMTNGYLHTWKEEMERILSDVSTNISSFTDWKKLARRLKVPECSIQNIDADYQKIEEKAFQALMKWFHMYGHSATKDVLIKALRTESNLIADEICGRYNIPEIPTKPSQDPGEVENVLSLGKELTSLLNNNQENLETCDLVTLIERQRSLSHLLNMERTVSNMITNIEHKPLTSTAADLIRNEKRECNKRKIHTEQTIRLIQYLLERITSEMKRTRSEVPKRSASFADQRIRSNRRHTYSLGDSGNGNISSPIFPRKKET